MKNKEFTPISFVATSFRSEIITETSTCSDQDHQSSSSESSSKSSGSSRHSDLKIVPVNRESNISRRNSSVVAPRRNSSTRKNSSVASSRKSSGTSCLSQQRGKPKLYCIEKEEKSEQKQPPRFRRTETRSAVLKFSTALERTAFFSPRCPRASFAAPLRQAVTSCILPYPT